MPTIKRALFYDGQRGHFFEERVSTVTFWIRTPRQSQLKGSVRPLITQSSGPNPNYKDYPAAKDDGLNIPCLSRMLTAFAILSVLGIVSDSAGGAPEQKERSPSTAAKDHAALCVPKTLSVLIRERIA
jgi:hypothetical protein